MPADFIYAKAMASGPSTCPIKQLPTGKVDLRVVALHRETAPRGVEAEQLPFLAAELAVAIGESNLPVTLAGMTRCNEQLRAVVVQHIDQRPRRVRRGMLLDRLAAGQFADHFALVQFAVPKAFVTDRQFDLRGGCRTMNHQRRLLPHDPQGRLGIIAGNDAPKRVGIGIVVQLSRELMCFGNELAAGFGRPGNKADKARHRTTQGIASFGRRFVVDKHFGPVLVAQRRHDGLPLPILGGCLGDDYAIPVVGRRG